MLLERIRPIPVIDLAQLKALLTVYYSTPWAVLERSDNYDCLPDAKAIEYKLVDVPTTGRTLADCITWLQLRSLLLPLATEHHHGVQGWREYVLKTWVGQDYDEEYPRVTPQETAKVIRELVVKIGELL